MRIYKTIKDALNETFRDLNIRTTYGKEAMDKYLVFRKMDLIDEKNLFLPYFVTNIRRQSVSRNLNLYNLVTFCCCIPMGNVR